MIKEDLTGKKFGRLTVIKNTGDKDAAGSLLWQCLCYCGNEKTTTRNRLTNGVCLSCGCYQKEVVSKNAKTHKLLSIEPGEVYGHLTVLSLVEKKFPREKRHWVCECICGKVVIKITDFLKSKNKNQSCGCVRKQNSILAKPKGWSGFRKVYSSYKKQAGNRNYPFELTKPQMWDITRMDCYYCGSPPSNIATPQKQKQQPTEYQPKISSIEHGTFPYNGVDRKDNDKGYTMDNCVPCCKNCNKAKLNLTYENFLSMIKKIYEHMNLGE